jgi:hypothetical protein
MVTVFEELMVEDMNGFSRKFSGGGINMCYY